MSQTGRQPSATDLQRVLARIFQTLLHRDEVERASRPATNEEKAEEELYDVVWENDGTDEDAPDKIHVLKSVRAAEHAVDVWRDRISRNEIDVMAEEVDVALTAEGIDLDKAHPLYRVLMHKSARAALRAAEISFDRERNLFSDDDFDSLPRMDSVAPAAVAPPPAPVAAPPQPTKPPAPLLSEAFEMMRAGKIGKDWGRGGKDHRDSSNALEAFLELMGGDRPIDKITSEDAFKYRVLLGKLPSLKGKGIYAGISAPEMIKRADAVEKGTFRKTKDAQPLPAKKVSRFAAKTINKYMTYFTSLYNYKPIEDLGHGHPFGGTLFNKEVLENENSRFPWEMHELAALFRSPAYTGCAGPEDRATPGKDVIQDSLYWAPLLGLYAGMRLEEIAGLRASDIAERDGIWFIDVKRTLVRPDLKSRAATRHIPIHPVLQALGFVAFARQHTMRLFPECLPGGPEERLSYKLSKEFTQYRREVGITNEAIDHHALRHNR